MQEERNATSAVRVEPRRSPVALDGDSNTINISKDSRFSGQLKFSGTIIVEGEIEGALEADRVIVRESGTASAKLSGESIMIAGKVTGDVIARRELEMSSTGKLIGDVTTPQLRLDPGATIKGRCAIG